jgi:hypothetical protein
MSEIEEDLERHIERVEAELAELKRRVLQKKLDACPVKVGDIVRSSRGRGQGKDHRVVDVDLRFYTTKPWVVGSPRRADGTFGTGRRHLYSDYELVGKEGEKL